MPSTRPLTPLEQLLLRDQRPGFPMAFFIHCDVEGPLEPGRLETALRKAASRHPLLRSRVGHTWWRPHWLQPDVEPELLVYRRESTVRAATETTARPPHDPWGPIDIRRTSGVRMVAIERSEHAWQVVIQFQHSVCDGLAGIEFFGDVWSLYHGDEPPSFRLPGRLARHAVDPQRAAGPVSARQDGTPAADPAGRGREAARTETIRFASMLPATLARGPADGAAGDEPHDVHTTSQHCPQLPYQVTAFSREETATLKARAVAASASLNDVVVAAVMRAACAWNAAAGRPAGSVRITMPASLKQPGARTPACNDMGYAFLDRTAAECSQPAQLVRSIAAASRWIQENRAAAVFLHALAAVEQLPPLLWLLSRLPVTMSTAVVSYVGNLGTRMRANVPRQDGCDLPADLRITAIAGVPPIRPGTRLAVGVGIYDGQLRLSTLCDVRALGRAAATLLPVLIRGEVLGCAAMLPAPTDDRRLTEPTTSR